MGANFGHPRVVEHLLSYPGIELDTPCGADQSTALFIACCRGDSPEIIQLLLDHDADINLPRGSDGSTPLCDAA